MFRIGGSAGTGITSGLDKPRKQYQQGTMPNFQFGGLPGFLTQFGLNLLSTPPQGNIFSTAATAARDPFAALQASQVESMKTASDRKFARELAQEEREFEEGQLKKKLAAQKEIAGMTGQDYAKRLEAAREDFGDGIKAARAIEFEDTKFKEFEDRFGEGQVATKEIDSDAYLKPGSIEKLVKRNPRLTGLKIYDVATNKVVVIVKNKETGKFQFVPADSADIDTTGDAMPEPKTGPDFTYLSPGQQKTLENIREASDSDFGMGFYE